MTIEELRGMKKAEPFRPFVIHLTDGRRFSVPTPKHISVSPTHPRFLVWKNNAYHFFEVPMVKDIEPKKVKQRRKRRSA